LNGLSSLFRLHPIFFEYFYGMDASMKITFLGTGTSQGIPIIGCKCPVCRSSDPRDNRLRTSIMVQSDSYTLVIDTGPDFRYQMLREKVSSLDAVLFTHAHRDHIAGLDDVRAFNFMQRRAMEIFAEERVQKEIRNNFIYAFSDDYPGRPRLNLNTIHEAAFNVGPWSVVPVRLMHDRLPILGFRFDQMTYITDASYISRSEIEKVLGCEVLVVNALRKEPHPTHFNLDQALDLIGTVNPGHAYLTHISHQLGLHREIQAELPANVSLAHDGLKVEVRSR
jgi:phosphoribosyl 1,2-cyclic phosphate phosphodiesterase